jgi:hypothetical protein
MSDKTQTITMLREEFNRWEELLAGMSEEQITGSKLHSNRSIKDEVAHLWVWQRISVARIEAAVNNKEPGLAWWPERFDPEAEEDLDEINEWIYETNREKAWSQVYKDWREGCLRFIELAEKVSEKDLLDPQKYTWLEGHPLILVLQGSYEHHHEDHLEPLLAWLRQHGNMNLE